MIIGFGNDLIDIRRIEKLMENNEQRFTEKYFTDLERETAETRRVNGNHICAYAKRFAAKEACAKALGTGFQDGIYMRDIGVINDEFGRPSLELTGAAAKRLKDLTPDGMKARLHLTLSDEPPMAQACVIIEAL